MERSWTDTRLYTVTDWIMKLAYINLLWLLFTFIGIVVFGIMPATVALFTVVRQWLEKEGDLPLFKTFFSVFKREFFKANLIGVILAVAGYVLYIDFLYLSVVHGYVHTFLASALVLVTLWFTAMTMFIIPVYVHYDLPFFKYFNYAFIISLINPHIVIFMGLLIAVTYRLFTIIPGLILFFFASAMASIIMWCALLAFKRMEKKKQGLEKMA
ncbi:YesL family protein [Bacillus sp. A116_S68]|nr:YesL family protein [Bacillus sp. A116_S68]